MLFYVPGKLNFCYNKWTSDIDLLDIKITKLIGEKNILLFTNQTSINILNFENEIEKINLITRKILPK